MNILLIGSGGREHAIALALHQSDPSAKLYFAPGNPGMTELGQRLEIDVDDHQGLLLFAQKESIDLTIVGPEAPLAAGLADTFRKHGLLIFGPNKDGAQLEASKNFAKQLMADFNIPTAGYQYCERKEIALSALDQFKAPYVIKEDGLAAGKGVTVAPDREKAEAAIDRAFEKNMPVVIEEFLEGDELSVLAVCDGQRAIPLTSAQDFKRLKENNAGPNTGGMGAYAPVPLATPDLLKTVQDKILDPMINALNQRGIDFRGVLYAGLMIDEDGNPSVVEFNVRFGDPETQVVLPLLDENFIEMLTAAAEGNLSAFDRPLKFKDQCAVTVVLVSDGYPGSYEKGCPIQFPQYLPNNVHICHAGTKRMPSQDTVTNGGRVLNIVGLGDSLETARENAYSVAKQVQFKTKQFRTDIAAEPSQPRALATKA